ncbi:MAG TPA: DUF3352 domain-containing protein [Syntrophomonadaceae bacterium]|nr:DUF3352 domain-containing protein [Syntrophomonadaceae bacterium]
MKYCTNCGQQLPDEAGFCTSCGTAQKTAAVAPPPVDPSPVTTMPSAVNPIPVTNAVPPADPSPMTTAPTTANPVPVTTAAPPSNPESVSIPYQGLPLGGTTYPNGAPGTPLATAVPPKKRRTWLWVTGGVVLFLLLACAAVYSMGNFSGPRSPRLASANTEMFLCVKPNMFQVNNFNHLRDIYMAVPEVKDAVEKFKKQMQEENDIDFDKDIDPWLGKEAALFMPKLDNQDKVAMAIEYKDAEKAKAFMAKAENNKSAKRETYNGIEITTYQGDASIALVDNFMIISSDRALLLETIDRSKGKIKDNLESNADYQRVLSALPSNRSAFWYVNLKQAMASSSKAGMGDISGLKDLSMAMQSLQGAGAAITLESNGVRGDYVLAFDKQGVPDYLKNSDKGKEELKATLDMMPEETLGFLYSSSLVNIVQESLKNPGSNSDLAQIKRSLNEIQSATGINVQTQVLDMLRGDAIIAVTPHYGDFFGQSGAPVSMVLALGVQDQQAATRNTEDVLSKMEKFDLKVDRKTVNGSKMYNISQQYGGDSISLGLGNKLLILGSSPELTNIVLSKHTTTLGANSDFKKAFDPFPGAWAPQLYVNTTKASKAVSDSLTGSDQSEYRKQVMPWMGPMKSISAADSAWDQSKAVTQGAFFIRIEKP